MVGKRVASWPRWGVLLLTLAVVALVVALATGQLGGSARSSQSSAAVTRVRVGSGGGASSGVKTSGAGSGAVVASAAKAAPASPALTVPRAVGQLIIATYKGVTPPAEMLTAVRKGQVGAIILMGDNTAGGLTATAEAVAKLQHAAHAGKNSGLLIMTDQEGGEVKRLTGAPAYSASQMSNPKRALAQGKATAKLLKQAGVNVDLAPVADVTRTDGFMTQEHRTFGSKPAVVAAAACAFASGLQSGGIAYTLKHFPGLGDAVQSTDNVPVSVIESAADIHADDQAYRKCGNSPLALVMVSSASYTHLTGSTPAVLSPKIYKTVMPSDGIKALAISDSFETGAIDAVSTPARRGINAGLDMVMYANTEAASASAYPLLVQDVTARTIKQATVQAAAAKVLALKTTLGLRK